MERAQLLLTRRDAAKLLAISVGTLDALVRRGDIVPIRLSPRVVRFDLRQIERLIEARARPPPECSSCSLVIDSFKRQSNMHFFPSISLEAYYGALKLELRRVDAFVAAHAISPSDPYAFVAYVAHCGTLPPNELAQDREACDVIVDGGLEKLQHADAKLSEE